MAKTPLDPNRLILKQEVDGRLVTYRRTKLKYSLLYTSAITKNGLATFTSGRDIIALNSDEITIGSPALAKESLSEEAFKILQRVGDYFVDGPAIILKIPRDNNNIKINSNENTFEVEVDGEDGLKYKCYIDPLGFILDVTDKDGKVTRAINTRPEIEDFLKLDQRAAQARILNCTVTSNLLAAILNKDNKSIKTPQTISELPVHLIDMHFQSGIDESTIKPDENGLYTFHGEGSDYSISAIRDTDGNMVYFATQGDKTYVCNNGKFQQIQSFRFTRKGVEQPLVTFTLATGSKKGENSVSVKIPLNEGKEPSAQFTSAIAAVVEGTVRESTSSSSRTAPISEWKEETADVAYLKPVKNSGYSVRLNAPESPSPVRDVPPAETHDGDISRVSEETGDAPHAPVAPVEPGAPVSPDPAPAAPVAPVAPVSETEEPAPAPHPSVGGVRTNPYKAQPKKPVKKEPRKLNEDAILYGGGTIGLFLMFMVAIPVIGAFLFAAGAAVFTASMLISANIHAFNNNPYNGLVTQYINQLNGEQNDAEEQAEHFWQIETERGNESDKLQAMTKDYTGPEFLNSPDGILLANLFDTSTPDGQKKLAEFLSQDSEHQAQFVEGLREIYAAQAQVTAPSDDLFAEAERTQKQKDNLNKLLLKYGIIDKDTPNSAFEDIYAHLYQGGATFENPDGSRQTLTAHQLLEKGIISLGRFYEQKQKVEGLTQQVDDALAGCSSLGVERILSQPNADIARLMQEDKHGFARLFISGRIPQVAIERIYGMLATKADPNVVKEIMGGTDEHKNGIVDEMRQIKTDLEYANTLGAKQQIYDNKYKYVQRILTSMSNILEAPTNPKQPGAFDVRNLRTIDQTAQDIEVYKYATYKRELLNRNKSALHVTLNDHLADFTKTILTSAPSEYLDTLKTYYETAFIQNLDDAQTLIAGGENGFAGISQKITAAAEKGPDGDGSQKGALVRHLNNSIIDQLYATFTHSTEPPTGSTPNAVLPILNKNKDFFAQLGNAETVRDQTAKMAFLLSKIQDKKTSVFAITDKDGKVVAQYSRKELEKMLTQIMSGDYAAKVCADLEQRAFVKAMTLEETSLEEAQKTFKEKIPSTAQARARALAMTKMLDEFAVQKNRRYAIIEKASELAVSHDDGKITREDLVRAIYETNKDQQVTLYDAEAEDDKNSPTKTLEEYIGKDNPELKDIQSAAAKIKTDRQNREAGSKKELEKVVKKTDRVQAEFQYQKGKESAEKKTTGRIAKAGEAIASAIGKVKGTFQERRDNKRKEALDEAEAFVKALEDQKEDKVDPDGTKTTVKKEGVVTLLDNVKDLAKKETTKDQNQRREAVNSLEKRLQEVLGKDMKKFFKSGFGKDIKSWDDLKEKIAKDSLTQKDVDDLIAQAKKFIKKKDKRLSSRLRTTRKKNKDKKKEKGLTQKQLDENIAATQQAGETATTRHESTYKVQTAEAQSLASETLKEVTPQPTHKVERE